MARGTAERGSIHISDAAIAGRADDHEVDEGRDQHKIDAAPKYRIAQVDLGEVRRDVSRGLKRTTPEEYPNRNQNQAEDKEAGQDQIEENAQIGIGGTSVAEKLDDPKADKSEGGGAGERPPIRLTGLLP